MRWILVLSCLCGAGTWVVGQESAPKSAAAASPAKSPEEQAVAEVLDQWHLAAAQANGEKYFSFFAKEGVFFGTDMTERWTRDEFRAWAKPYFTKGKAWSFEATKRHVFFSKERTTAWFDEELKTPNLGPARGTGVLIQEDGAWKIAQYNLSVPIPNDVFKEVKSLIEKHLKPQ